MNRGLITIAILIAAGYGRPTSGQTEASVPNDRNTGASRWRSIGPQGGEIRAISVDPHHPKALYAATGSQSVAFKSLDGGAHWVVSRGPNQPLVFDPQDPNTIYAFDSTNPMTSNGITKSTDGGISWKPANSGLPSGGGFLPPQVIALAIDPLNRFTLYAGTVFGIFKSTDEGTNWTSASSGLPMGPAGIPTAHYVYLVVIDPQNPSTLYAVAGVPNTGDRLLFKSSDGGGNWNPSGLGDSLVYSLAIDPQHPSTLYAGTDQGVFKTTDGGTGWKPVNSGLPPFPLPRFWAISSMVIDPLTPGTVYVAIDNLSRGRVFKTTNGGGSWSDSSSGLPEALPEGPSPVLQIDPLIPTTLYAGTNAGVFRTTDGGTSWAAVNSGLTATPILDVTVDPWNSSILYAETARGLAKTTDGGMSWILSDRGYDKLAIDPQNTSKVFAAGCTADFNCGVVKSTDGGTTWNQSWTFPDWWGYSVSSIAIDPQNSNFVYATTQGNDACDMDTLHKTMDGGVTWSDSQFKDIGVFASCLVALAVDPRNSWTLYAAFQNGGVFKSTDGAATWNPANSGLSPGNPFYTAVALAIDPGNPRTLYAVSFSGIFKSSDGGMSWNPASSGLPNWSSEYGGPTGFFPRLAVDPQDTARVYLGIVLDGVQRVFQSSDGGANWIDSGLALFSYSTSFGGLTISSQGPNTVYAGSYAGLLAFKPVAGTARPKD